MTKIEVEIPPAPPPVKITPAPQPPGVVDVVKSFDNAKSREMGAITRLGATLDSVERIYRADLRAKIALHALGLHRLHMTEAVLREARDAVHDLQDSLDNSGM